ncbi:hypothetical protein L2K70_08435 [Nocardioides KLBMP 9356]|uniref:WD40 repeat domain-containing protein n=1 Tax=Nocardioides potassii TaxID=2911371 RepID=A0ABS9HBP0_9ACTN|nr:hypothetical protein [Nocardioides potassii]MCF6377629.1 hypothetical protein [Nocardioides potassii]
MPAPTDVVDRLDRLAARAPSGAVDPEALWARGRRRQRRRTASALAAIVTVGVLATALTPSVLARIDPPVATSTGRMVLPDVVRQPGEWEPSFSSVPGRLVAAGVGSRAGWWSSRPALWGVSAVTGESRFLDLPDAVPVTTTPVALSADGQLLAYWFTNDDVDVLPADVDENDAPAARPAGVAVLHLATGEVERWDAKSAHGLQVDGLAWAGDVLWWSAGSVEPVGTIGLKSGLAAHTWDLGSGVRRTMTSDEPGWALPLSTARSTADGFLVNGARDLRLVRGNHVDRRVWLERRIRNAAALGADGRQVAAVLDADPSSGASMEGLEPVVVGDLTDDPVAMAPVGDVRADDVYGWRSDTEVVVGTRVGAGADMHLAASTVDVRTGEEARLLEFEGAVPTFAADAWSADVVQAPDAPFAPDPRLVGAGGAVVLVFLVSLWRDLRRRRGRA